MAQSLTRIHLQIFLIVFLCFAAIAYAGYLAVRDMQQSIYQESASRVAAETVGRINGLLTQQNQALEKIARQAGTATLLQRGTAVERARKEDEIKSQLAGAASIHLLPGNSSNISAAETLDAACLDYVRRMAVAQGPGAPEFHALDATGEHYDFVVPVLDETRKTAGYLVASFSSAPLQAVLEQSLPRHAHMELQQPAGNGVQAVLAAGESPMTHTATVTSTLGFGGWMLVYQPGEAPPGILAGNRIYYFGVILIAFGIVGFMLFRVSRRTVLSVRHDIRSLIRMFRDLREGSVRVGYPMALREFSEIFDYLRDRGQKLVEEKEKLKDMGLVDHLSQLGNRRHFEMRLQELFEASKANGPSSVLIIDMDHFKAVNDNHGHDAGDALIVGFANALRKVVRQTDVLVRLGGDEFCIIYTYASLDQAKTLAERLRKQLPREIALTKGVIHQLRWTGGLSAMHDKDGKPDDVLWRADQALLQAKEAGRNVTKVYDPIAGLPAKKQIMVS